MIRIIKSGLFSQFPEISFGFSTKIGLNRTAPYYFNLSFTVGDDSQIVKENRNAFFTELGLRFDEIAFQKQIHSDIISIADKPGMIGESDALITDKLNLGLAVSSADCTPVFIFDRRNHVIAAVHSGWRGTEKEIVSKTLTKLSNEFNSLPEDLYVYVGPSVSADIYEVGEDVASLFSSEFVNKKNGKLFLDVAGVNIKMIMNFGISSSRIEVSPLCSFAEDYLHSYRRDGKISGRALGVISMNGKSNER